jgi:hypothetical protein
MRIKVRQYHSLPVPVPVPARILTGLLVNGADLLTLYLVFLVLWWPGVLVVGVGAYFLMQRDQFTFVRLSLSIIWCSLSLLLAD